MKRYKIPIGFWVILHIFSQTPLFGINPSEMNTNFAIWQTTNIVVIPSI